MDTFYIFGMKVTAESRYGAVTKPEFSSPLPAVVKV